MTNKYLILGFIGKAKYFSELNFVVSGKVNETKEEVVENDK